MDQTKSYKTKESVDLCEEHKPTYIDTAYKLSIKEINKVCNSSTEYFINNNSSLFIKAYLITILLALLLCIFLFVLYTI